MSVQMKKLFFLAAIVLVCKFSVGQNAMYAFSKTLINNDTAVMVSYPSYNPCKAKEMQIVKKYYADIMGSTLLKAMGVADYQSNVQNYFTRYLVGFYKEGMSPICCFDSKLNEFLHKIIKVKKVREFGLQQICSLLCDFCRFYPKDFTDVLYAQLYIQKYQVEDMKNHSYEVVANRYGVFSLYIDGRENESLANTTIGFLIRRIIIDEIPAEEIIEALDFIMQSIDNIDINNNPDFLCKTTINNEIEYRITSLDNYYYFKNSNDTLMTYSGFWGGVYNGSTIKYFKDRNESFYQIENGYMKDLGYKKEWIPYRNEDKLKILLDNNGKEIYRE